MEELGINGVDTTGWVRIVSNYPAILMTHPGATRAPWVRDETIQRLTGPSTSRVLRQLIASGAPLGVRELALACSVSPGTVAKLLPTLTREGIITRTPQGGFSQFIAGSLFTDGRRTTASSPAIGTPSPSLTPGVRSMP